MPDVYDKEQEKVDRLTGQHDDLGMSPEDRSSEIDALNDSFYSPDGSDVQDKEEAAEKGEKNTNADASEIDKLGGGSLYNPEKGSGPKKSGSFFQKNKKKMLTGGIGTGAGGLLIGMLMLLPLKVEHMVNNLQKTFFASSEQAAEDMSDTLFRSYVVKKVIPGMYKTDKCHSTRASKSCAAISDGTSPVSALYNAWRDKNFEGKLAEKYGLEIRREGNRFFMRSDALQYDIFSGTYDPNNPQVFENQVFSQMDRSETRQAVHRAYAEETMYKRMIMRYKVGRLLERKYGITRCLVACESRDNRADRHELRKLKWKAYFIDKITTPRTEMISIALKCAIGGFTCTEPGEPNEDGERPTDIETETRNRISELNRQGIDVARINTTADSIRSKGLTQHIVASLTNELTSKIIGGSLPVVGWIDISARIFDGLGKAGPAFKKINYVVNSTTYVAQGAAMLTLVSESHLGEADAADIGIVSDSLGVNNGKGQGGGGAESSPLYQEVMGTSSTKTTSLYSLFMPSAYAAPAYKCNNGETIASGVCPELKLNAVNGITKGADGVSSVVNADAMAPVGAAAGAWLATGGLIFDKVGGFLGDILSGALSTLPGYDKLIEYGEDIAKSIGTWFATKIINDPYASNSGEDPSGARNFDVMTGGFIVMGNDFAHYGQGGQRLSDVQVSQIRSEREAREKQEFSQKSFVAKMFDSSSKYSLVSKVAMAMPSTTSTGVTQAFSSAILNPFGAIRLDIGNQSVDAANAAGTATAFGVSQYGYDKDDPVFSSDPEKYWEEQNCDDPERINSWSRAATPNPDTGMLENDQTNGCKLLESTLTASGAQYGNFLTAEELGDSGDEVTTSTEPVEFTVASYNILQGIHHYPKLCNAGENEKECINRRSELQAKIITGQTGNAAFDIVGMQEVSPEQYLKLRELLPNYDYFPKNANRISNQEDGSHAIYWNKDKFSLVDSGTAPGVSNVANTENRGNITVPWVKLQAVTGQTVFFMSVHWPNSGFYDPDLGDKETLKKAVGLARQWVSDNKDSTSPVIIVGDFNDNPSQKTTYCGLTNNGLMQHALDTQKGKTPGSTCDPDGLGGIDHIYSTPVDGLKASNWTQMKPEGDVSKASDHEPVFVTYSLPGQEGITTSLESLKVGTYNVLNADRAGSKAYDPSDDVRMRDAAELMINKELSLIAIQEVGGEQRAKLVSYMPKNFSATKSLGAGGDIIMWDSTLFSKVDEGQFMVPKWGNNRGIIGNEREAIWVKLESKETQESLYMFSVHLDTHAQGRQIGADRVVKEIEKLSKDKDPIILAGDMNSNYFQSGRDQAFQTFNASKKLSITSQKVSESNRKGYNCDTQNGFDGKQDCRGADTTGSHLDQIWISNYSDIAVDSWENIANADTIKISDHNPVVASLTIPGITGVGGGATGSVTMGDDYTNPKCTTFKNGGAPGLACDGECVDFVKFRLKKHIARDKFASLGNGAFVVGGLGSTYGYKVDSTPAVNAVVSWPVGGVEADGDRPGYAGYKSDPGEHANTSAGHTAMVSGIKPDGSIVVEETNADGTGSYGTRTIPANVAKLLTYAHTEVDYK